MTDFFSYLSELQEASDDQLPPVQSWNPERAGKIDITIKRDGTWVHEGEPIKRARLARLFSTILRRDGNQYYLVTPYEKLKICVEDAPFVAVVLRVEGEGETQNLYFTTNLGDIVLAGGDHTITILGDDENETGIPYIDIRHGLLARIERSVYYDLVALCEVEETSTGQSYVVWSNGETFSLGAAEENQKQT